MTVDQWYNNRKGQSLLVPGADEEDRGQCMQAWDYGLNEIYGLPYIWANAIDVWDKFDSFPQLKNNFDKITDGSIKKGDGVVFNTSVGSVYGHIDWALRDGSTANFLGADSNWGGNKTLHEVTHVGAQFILGSIRLKGGEMPLTSEQIDKFFKMAGQNSKASDYTYYAEKAGELADNLWGSSGAARWAAWGDKPLPDPSTAPKLLAPGIYEVKEQ